MGCLDVRPAWELLYRSGLSAAVGRGYAGIGAIFAFHRVAPDVSARLDRELYVSAGFLEAWLASVRKAGVPVVSMDEAVERIRDPGPRPSGRRFVVVSFDDGYADVVAHALPMLERFDAPFTVHVTTDLVDGRGCPWWLGLERLFRENDAVDVAPMERAFPAGSLEEKRSAAAEVTAWVAADEEQRAPLLRRVFDRYGVSLGAAAREAGLSLEQLRALGRHPLATVGGHTTSHPDLTKLGEAQAYREMADNKAWLEDVCGSPVRHFAYPHGACGLREAALARKAGFETAATVRSGCLFPEHRDHLLALPRCPVRGSRMWLSFLHAQRHGVPRFIQSRGGCPVATL